MTRLTEEMVIARSKQSDLGNIKKLNCWGSELSDVSIIRRMRAVEVLALSVNRISTLADFEDCINLQELYLRKNNIHDINDLVYLQNLQKLKNLWLEENPCVEKAGTNYRSIVLRALPNLKKLDNVEVTPEEVENALRLQLDVEDRQEAYEEPYVPPVQQPAHPQQPPQQQHHHQQQPPPQLHPYRNQSPTRESSQSQIQASSQQASPENTESECISDPNPSIPSSPMQRTPPNQDIYSPGEPNHPPSPRYQNNRGPYHQYDRSPGSDQETSPVSGYRGERSQIAPSMSTHSMKEYYQNDYQNKPPAHYRHSQSDLTEWDDNHQNNHSNNNSRDPYHAPPTQQQSHQQQRRSNSNAGGERYEREYRNGNGIPREREEWEDTADRKRVEYRRSEGRFSDSASVLSNAVLNHFSSIHRRPVNRNSNLLSATLCLVKELDYPSLEVVEHAVRCRIDELTE